VSNSDADILKRVPPQNLDAEQSVLGAILLDNDAINWALEIVSPEDFYREMHREIFRAMVDLTEHNKPVDAIMLSDLLRTKGALEAIGGASYIAELAAVVPTAENVVHYARTVREKAVLRLLGSVATQIASRAFDSPLDVRSFLADAESCIAAVTRLDIGAREQSLADAVRDVLRSLERGELAGVSSGFPNLDKNLSPGGFARGDLNIIAGTTSVGKTTLAANIAVRVPRGGTLFFSVEMSRDQIIRRMIADLGLVDWAAIARRRPSLPEDYEAGQIAHGAERLLELSIEILHRRELTPSMVRREARLSLQNFNGKLDLIVIDYLQLMDADPDERRRRDRRDLEIGSITKALKSIASEFKCPVLLLSQLNREAAKTESGEPELWHLRESGSIEQDADVVIFLWEPRDKSNPNLINWKIAKQRNGSKVQLNSLRFEGEFTRFREQ
jgi:replicative DNA helicase